MIWFIAPEIQPDEGFGVGVGVGTGVGIGVGVGTGAGVGVGVGIGVGIGVGVGCGRGNGAACPILLPRYFLLIHRLPSKPFEVLNPPLK